MWNIEGFIREPGQGSFGQSHDLDGHIDAHHEHGPVNHVFDMVDISHDFRPLADAPGGCGKTYGQIGGNG